MNPSRPIGSGTALVLMLAAGLSAQAGTPTLDSYRQARDVLDAAVAAAGGAERINAIETVLLEQTGTGHARNQSPDVQPPFEALPNSRRAALDLKNGWAMAETTGRFPGGFIFSARQVLKGQEKFTVDLVNKTFQKNDQLQTAVFDPSHRLFPPLMLRKALQRLGTLRSLGQAEVNGRKQDVIAFAWDNGGVYTLYFDAKSHLLTKYELLFADALTGDAVAELYFSDYREVDGLQVPDWVRQRIAGDLLNEWKHVTVQINKPLEPSLFAPPAGFEELAQQPPPAPEVVELAKELYLVKNLGQGGGYNMLAVAFDDHLLTVEAPLSPTVTAQALGLLKQKVPGKPIRYAVLTHHHDDHSGGVAALVAEGAKIVTVAASTEYLKKMASAVDTLTPGAPAPNTNKPQFELVEGKRVFGTGARTVEIHDIGPNPHVKHMFVVYVPSEKLVFQGDLMFKPAVGPIPAAIDATRHFAQQLQKLGLEVERIAAVHGEVASMDDFKAALDKKLDPSLVGQLR
jgi:glyoxylase-like metal-dependent hydrolase (beta-lactamase superfamily II)